MKSQKQHFFMKLFFAVSLLVLLVAIALPQGWCTEPNVLVVASTAWTGAIAEAAGAGEVRVLAPMELKHPPEYDYRPADIAKLNDAAFVVYAGYELFMKKLLEAAAYSETKIFTIMTMNELPSVSMLS